MVLSSDLLEQQKIEIENDITLLSESRVKLLGVIIDDRPQFNDHISAMCCRAARQLNALARISKHLNSKSKRIVYNSFVASNFNYCPLVWHFCGQVKARKIELKIKARKIARAFTPYYSKWLWIILWNITKMFEARVLVDKKIKNHDFRGFQNRQ